MSQIRLENGRAVITGRLGLDTLMAYRRLIESELPVESDLVVDLSGLDAEDSAVLAMLVFLLRRSRSSGSRVTFEGAGERIIAMAQLAGIDDLLVLRPAP